MGNIEQKLANALGLSPDFFETRASTHHVEYASEYFRRNIKPNWNLAYLQLQDMLEHIERICKHTPYLSRNYVDHDLVYRGGFGRRTQIYSAVLTGIYVKSI